MDKYHERCSKLVIQIIVQTCCSSSSHLQEKVELASGEHTHGYLEEGSHS